MTMTGGAPLPKPVGPLGLRHVGRYEIIAKLASGGMATVYLGRLAGAGGFERRVAIKILHPHLAEDPSTRASFLDEARLAASIRHPHVVPVIDVGDEPETGTFLVMEYIEGCDLSALLKAAGKARRWVPRGVALRIVMDLLAGLEAAHGQRDPQGNPLHLVHRDVSPHNLIIGRDGVARLTDFGIAKAEGRMAQTRTGQLKGKLSYMPPERLKGIRDAGATSEESDHRGDLYAAGVVLWETLTGARLFRGRDDFDVLKKVMDAPVDPPSVRREDVAALDEVVMHSIEREPDARFSSAKQMREALEQLSENVGGVATPEEVREFLVDVCGARLGEQRDAIDEAISLLESTATPKPKERTKLWPVLALVAVVGLMAVAVQYGRGLDDPDETTIASPAAPTIPVEPDEPVVEDPPANVDEPAVESEPLEDETSADPEPLEAVDVPNEDPPPATTTMGASMRMRQAPMDRPTMDTNEPSPATMNGPAEMTTGMSGDEVIDNPYAI